MPSFHTFLKGGALLGVASTLLTISAPAARAQGACADTSGNIVVGTGFSCIIGDKLYSNFSGSAALASSEAAFQWSQFAPDTYNLSVQGLFGPGVYNLAYNVDIIGGSTDVFNFLRTSATSAGVVPPPVEWTKTLAAVPATDITPLIATEASFGGASVQGTFVQDYQSAAFMSTLTVTSNTVTQFQDTVSQRPTHTVPGPLPLLGAGAAFGFSRKLRRRIKVVA